jgi:CBS domain-containing protein
MNVESILAQKGTDVITIQPEASVKRATDWLRAKNVGALVVARDDAVLGIISERDIVHAFSQYGEAVASMSVMRLMTQHRVRHLPVLHNGKLAGIISIGDVVKRRLDDLELETKVLRDVYTASH